MPRKRRSPKTEMVAPVPACAGAVQEAASPTAMTTNLVDEPCARYPRAVARAVAAARGVLQRCAGINRSAGRPVRYERQRVRVTALANERRKSADMRRRK